MNISCPKCTFLNPLSAIVCELCHQHILAPTEAIKDNQKKRNVETIQTKSTVNAIADDHCRTKESNDADDSLSCPQCTYHNALSANICEICGYLLDDQQPHNSAFQSTSPSHTTFSAAHTSVHHRNLAVTGSEISNEVMQNDLIPLLENALFKQHHRQQQQQQLAQSQKKRRLSSPEPSVTFRLCVATTPHITQQGVAEGENVIVIQAMWRWSFLLLAAEVLQTFHITVMPLLLWYYALLLV